MSNAAPSLEAALQADADDNSSIHTKEDDSSEYDNDE
jgi:hypothetical protein